MKTAKKKIVKNQSKKKQPSICAPGSTDSSESFTCFTKDALKNIIRSWNSHYKDDKIIYSIGDSKYNLWTKMNEKLKSKCSNDYCWANQAFLADKKSVLKKEYFRPKMPNKWYEKSREWLNTDDIDNVMKQYEKQYDNFYFVGAVPMDFDKKLSFGSCVINELCTINIKRLLSRGKTKVGVILNLDNHDEDGSHWVSLFCDFDKDNIYYFDSYGYNETKEVKAFVKRLQEQGKKINKDIKFNINKNRHQYKTSECGVYSINFIERLLRDDPFDDISNIIVKDDDMFENRDRYFINKNNV
jgi:hypothetical protein